MTWLVLGLALWSGAHLFKRLFPERRTALGKAGRGLVAVAVLAAIALMIFGYRSTDDVFLYALPDWAWHLNNLMMLIAIFLMDIGRARGVVAAKIRHPMLSGVAVWAAAHLLVNGSLAALILFGGLGAWAVAEMIVINRAEGPWSPPAAGSIVADLRFAAFSVVIYIYAAIVGIHYWLDRPAMPGLF